MTNITSDIIELYPTKIELDLLYKNKHWQCIPILPSLNIDLVKNTLKKYIKNDDEKINLYEFN